MRRIPLFLALVAAVLTALTAPSTPSLGDVGFSPPAVEADFLAPSQPQVALGESFPVVPIVAQEAVFDRESRTVSSFNEHKYLAKLRHDADAREALRSRHRLRSGESKHLLAKRKKGKGKGGKCLRLDGIRLLS